MVKVLSKVVYYKVRNNVRKKHNEHVDQKYDPPRKISKVSKPFLRDTVGEDL